MLLDAVSNTVLTFLSCDEVVQPEITSRRTWTIDGSWKIVNKTFAHTGGEMPTAQPIS